MNNRIIAKELNEIADLLEMNEVAWKPRAYRSAARKIENMSQSIEEVYRTKGKDGLEEISSIGESLADHIAELLERGTVKKWEQLKTKMSQAHDLIQIEGLGPKKVQKLSRELGIKTIDDLKKAVSDHSIQQLGGFGEQTEENIRQSIAQSEGRHERMNIDTAWDLAWETIAYLKRHAPVKRIDYAGSLRRMKETIGDIDILAVTDKPTKLMDTFASMENVKRVLGKGKTKTSVILNEGVQIDLRIIRDDQYGAALQYFTGSKDHNIALRKIAATKGYKLSEYGLEEKKSKKVVAGKNEKDIYSTLGLQWIPPELRENRGEIEAAKDHALPTLVEEKDIRGDLQMHSTYSDGDDSIKDMVKKAKKKGYDYIAITDHSQSQRIAKGMRPHELKKQLQEIQSLSTSPLKMLRSAEVDILKDGTLDYDSNILESLDLVVASVHSGFKSTKNEMTQRILKAIKSGSVDILAHPTGRIINRRTGYDADFTAIFKHCAINRVAVEINCDPERLDLNDKKILSAKQQGCLFSLGTDAHTKESLDNLKFGIGQARRGWLTKDDILNTRSYEQLKQFLAAEKKSDH